MNINLLKLHTQIFPNLTLFYFGLESRASWGPSTHKYNLQLTAVWADVDGVESRSELANILLEWAPHVTSKECYLLT